ncbi:DUF7144 family membrane protein [Streptomyces indicus]|uniref:DUF7144 domain-containing protein n=1 Tax=Streptomyces indicus TaxID=417292 RepID=A0A1G9CM70_9ACTN|nr:hypothetical protein SAMN05421806_108198 [Streptomyces indicus]
MTQPTDDKAGAPAADTHPGWASASGGPASSPSGAGKAPGSGDGARSDWAVGGTMFAGVLMGVAGIVGALQGIAAIAEDDVYTRIGDYVFSFDLTTWGWIHLLFGIVVAIAGFGILKGQDWARGAGIGLAALYVVEYFLFLPYAPVWSVIAIALGVFVIWALATDS